MEAAITLISTLGFPIAACVLLGLFIFIIYKNTTKQNADNMAAVQARCKEREDKLYTELKESREVTTKALVLLEQYAEKLNIVETIQSDVNEIKTDISILMAQ